MERSQRRRRAPASGWLAALGMALALAGVSPTTTEAQQSYGYSSRIEYACRGRSVTQWHNPAPVTGVLNHEKWLRDGSRWVRANARRTTQGPKTDGYIDHTWDGNRGRTNRITAIHSWSDRSGAMLTSSGDFYCP